MDDYNNSKPVKVLDIGVATNSTNFNPTEVFAHIENLVVETMDIVADHKPDHVHDIREPLPEDLWGAYDIVVMSHVLEHVEYLRSIRALYNVQKALRVGGELHLVVPALEWACQQVLMGRHTIGVQASIYGGQSEPGDYHLSGYTLQALRQMIEVLGFVTRQATQGVFYITFGPEHTEKAIQNYVLGLKVIEPDDPQAMAEKEAEDVVTIPTARR